MSKPLKISENNAPLSCKQHDDNIDALLDRRNHTNKIQDCESAIEQDSLNECVSNLESVQNIVRDLNVLRSEYDVLNASIIPNGDIDASIQDIGRRLDNALVPINATLLTLATDLELVTVDAITGVPRFLLPSELEARKNSDTNRRQLTRDKLDELGNRVDTFIDQNASAISNNTSTLAGLLNPTNGSFTLLQDYVNGTLTTESNKISGIDTRLQGVGNRLITVETLLNTGTATTIKGKSIKKNIEDLYDEDDNLDSRIQGVGTRIQGLETLAGNKNALLPGTTTIIGSVVKNSLDIDSLQRSSGDNGVIARAARDDLADLTTEVERRNNYLFLEKESNRVLRVNGGPYLNKAGGRGFLITKSITVPNATDSYFVYLKEGNVELETDRVSSGLLLGTIVVTGGTISNIYNSYNGPIEGIAKPILTRQIGGKSEGTSYVSSGTNGTLRGLQVFKSFWVKGGTKVTIIGGAKIVVNGAVRIDGVIEVLPVCQGARGFQMEVSRGFMGNDLGGGLGSHRINYHWTTLPAGSGGRNGLSGASDRDFNHLIPRGGSGGGGVIFESGTTITVSGNIIANGTDGRQGEVYSNNKDGGVSGSGGGAGGCVVLQAAKEVIINSTAKIRCNGGKGGNSVKTGNYYVLGAGGGGGGWITLFSPKVTQVSGSSLQCLGGAVGKNTGGGTSIPSSGFIGGSAGGSFCGKGGNGSATTTAERTADNGIIEVILEDPSI